MKDTTSSQLWARIPQSAKVQLDPDSIPIDNLQNSVQYYKIRMQDALRKDAGTAGELLP